MRAVSSQHLQWDISTQEQVASCYTRPQSQERGSSVKLLIAVLDCCPERRFSQYVTLRKILLGDLTRSMCYSRPSTNSCGPVAQLGARFHGMEEVESSNLSRSTKLALQASPDAKNKIQQIALQPHPFIVFDRFRLHARRSARQPSSRGCVPSPALWETECCFRDECAGADPPHAPSSRCTKPETWCMRRAVVRTRWSRF